LKNELSPAILTVSRYLNEKEPLSWGERFEALQSARERFEQMLKIVTLKLDDLKKHRENVQQS